MSSPRICPSCGTPTIANERFCANCGSRLSEDAAMVAPTLPIGQQPTPNRLPSLTPPPGDPTIQVGPPGTMPPPAVKPPRKGLPVWAIVILVLVGLCAISCVAGVVILNVVGERVVQQVGTAVITFETPISITTPLPGTTAEVQEQVTSGPTSGPGGIVNSGGELSAAQVAQTAHAAQTAAAVQGAQTTEVAQIAQAQTELAQILASGQRVFRDEFVDNRNAWFTGVFQEVEDNKIEGGVFKVIWSADGTSYELYEPRSFTNFIAEVDCLIYSGGTDGSCGLVFDQNDDIGFYKYEVFEDYYRLFIVGEGDPVILAEGDPEGIVRPGEPNQLRAIRQGERIWLFLNDVPLIDITDTTYTTGKIGVTTSSYLEEGGVEVWFDNFTIWELP